MSKSDPVVLEAVILGYSSGNGVLLCQKVQHPNIEATVEAYKKNPDSRGHWFVAFSWCSLSPVCRNRIIEKQADMQAKLREVRLDKYEQKLRSNSKLKSPKPAFVTLDKVVVGYKVQCHVVKDPKWKAIEIVVDFESKWPIPAKRIHCGHGPQKPTPKTNQTSEVRKRGVFGNGSNLHRPWQG